MKIFITGSNGLLGQKLISNIQENTPEVQIVAVSKGENRLTRLKGFTYYDLDISDESRVFELLVKESPDVVINAAAYTAVGRSSLRAPVVQSETKR